MFAARYGYDLDYFYSLTLRQVHAIKKVIEKKNMSDRVYEAQLHDKKIQGAVRQLQVPPKLRKEYNEDANKLYERLKARHESRSIN